MRDWKEEHLGLLEYLSLQVGCMYLSDLPQLKYRFCIQHALRGLSPECFGLKEWNDAAAYITRQDCSFKTADEAWQFLLDSTSLEYKAI